MLKDFFELKCLRTPAATLPLSMLRCLKMIICACLGIVFVSCAIFILSDSTKAKRWLYLIKAYGVWRILCITKKLGRHPIVSMFIFIHSLCV